METSRLILCNTPGAHPSPFALPFRPLKISLICLHPQPKELLGQISFKKNLPKSIFPQACSPDGLHPPPPPSPTPPPPATV